MRKTGNTTAYRENLRRKILETAMPLFKKKGIKAVRMDDIATEMAISKRTLYELYSNKEDLLYECIKNEEKRMMRKIAEYAENAENEMEVIAYFIKMKLKDFGSINPLFFYEINKYKRIVELLRNYKEQQRANSNIFMKRCTEQGFFRSDLNFEIVEKLSDAAINFVMQTQLYEKYMPNEILHTFILVYLRGCCTNKGLEYIDKLLFEN